jgi:cytidyltransferase-like protein
MIIGLIPGAMKPYHAGHHYLAEQAIKECDKVLIFTTAKDRKGISGVKMASAWTKLICPLLPKVNVKFVKSPVRAVYEFLEEANTEDLYRVYGGTEDVGRFSQKSLNKYCSHLNVSNVAELSSGSYLRGVGPSPKAKGEWVRNAIQAGDFRKFENYLPDFLKPYSKEYLKMLI